ncbi:MAG: hypothetical protein JXB60_08955 [Candidatus Cloacimonetes bacterium]|nr:hypothetical protein [Candidatus Cloacimonadota bacterium]
MLKKALILLIISLPLLLPAAEPEFQGQAGFHAGGMVGTIIINDKTYSQIRFMPELVLGKFGIGLDIELLIDSDGKIREEDWDNFEDYINKIYYIRYGLRGDPFYAKVGGFSYYTLGHGLIMKDYSNMLRYPEFRQIGLQIGGRIPPMNIELEGFTHNVQVNEILAARLAFQPFSNSNAPVIKNLKLGGTIVTDRDQYGKLDKDTIASIPVDTDGDGLNDDVDPDLDGDGLIDNDWLLNSNMTEEEIELWLEENQIDYDVIPDKVEFDEDDITIFGADYELPLIQSKVFELSHYGELAKIMDHNMGFIFPGFYSRFLIFHANLEFRYYQDDFLPSYFDHLYDEQRALVEGDTVYTKESILQYTTAARGWYGSLTANIFNILFLTIAYEDMYGEDDYDRKSIYGNASLQKILPRLTKAEFNYSQTGFNKLKDLEFKAPSALVSASLGYSLAANTSLVATYQVRYSDYDGDGKIRGKDETLKVVNIGVEFMF